MRLTPRARGLFVVLASATVTACSEVVPTVDDGSRAASAAMSTDASVDAPARPGAADPALAEALAYMDWLHALPGSPAQDRAGSEHWIQRLDAAASAEPGSRASLACRTQLIALLNELGDHGAAEHQVHLRLQEAGSDPERPFWCVEAAEARLRRLEGPEAAELDSEEAVAVFEWARGELARARRSSRELECRVDDAGRRELWLLRAYGRLAELGVVDPELAYARLEEGRALAEEFEGAGVLLDGLSASDFAFAAMEASLSCDPPARDRAEACFAELARVTADSDRVAQAWLRLTHGLHGQGSVLCAEHLTSWVVEQGVEGPNGHLVLLYLTRNLLARGEHVEILELVTPHLGLRPSWAVGELEVAWVRMQIQLALAYTAAAVAEGRGPDRDLGVHYLLAVETTGLDGENAAIARAAAFAEEVRAL